MSRRSYYMSRDRWTTRAGEAVVYGICRLFFLLISPFSNRMINAVMAPLGGWIALVIPGARRRAAENLGLIWPDLPPSRRRAIIRGAGAEFMSLLIEYPRLDRIAAHPERITTQGADVLAAVRSSGKGAVIVTAHYGNWEGVRLAARAEGVECGIIYRAFNNRYIDRHAATVIEKIGRPVLRKGRSGGRQLIAHIKSGGTAMILVDQRNSGAPFLPFLGEPAETVTAAADLARRAGVPLIPAVSRRTSRRPDLHVTFEKPVTTGTPEEMMTEVNDRISAWVEAHPEQWFWFHRRWRSTTRSRKPQD